MSLLTALLALAAGLHLCIGDERVFSEIPQMYSTDPSALFIDQGFSNRHHQTEDAFATLSTDLPDVQKEIIDKHNDLRRQVKPTASNMLKMNWNRTAAENCKNYASQCIYQHSPETQRTIENNMKCGENLFYSSALVSWSYVIQAWYNEEENFTYGLGPNHQGAVIGHYTAVVWYRSYLAGCAVAKCPHSLQYFYVCQYCPAGNVQGPKLYKPYKEGKPCGDCPNNCDDGLCTNPCTKDNTYSNCDGLKAGYTCQHPLVKEYCTESCQCTTEIR